MQTTLPREVTLGHVLPPRPEPPLPKLSELGIDLLEITPFQRIITLATPFLCIALYFCFVSLHNWPFAVIALMYLSFSTYGSISRDLVHRTLGLHWPRLAKRLDPYFEKLDIKPIKIWF
jgi:hypothetical protein